MNNVRSEDVENDISSGENSVQDVREIVMQKMRHAGGGKMPTVACSHMTASNGNTLEYCSFINE